MPFSNVRDLERMLEMSDNRFLALFERADETAKYTKMPEAPKVPNKERTRPQHAGTMFEQQRQYLIEMARRGIV